MNYAVDNILENCMESFRKRIFLIYDQSSADVVKVFQKAAPKHEKILSMTKVEIGNQHGEEPSLTVVREMLHCDAIMCITKYSMAHTAARKQTEERGIPFLSMPDYDLNILQNSAFSVNYKSRSRLVDEYAQRLTDGNRVAVTTGKGTELYLDIKGRCGNSCPGITDEHHLLASPPDIEANIAPLENYTHGQIVVDGSITDRRLGLLSADVILKIRGGAIYGIESADKKIENIVKDIFARIAVDEAYVVGEFGIGFNDKAELCGNMLVDEGATGCVHFGIGSNWTIGGMNRVNFHLDFVIKDATVTIDDNIVIKEGALLYG